MKPPSLLDPAFKYVPSVETDIAETFRRHGFTPPTEAKRDAQLKAVAAKVRELKPRRVP